MNHQCVLCFDEVPFIGITECNHGPFCFRCIYKMRVINKNNVCPICKFQSTQVVISEKFQKFGVFSEEILADKTYSDMFYAGENAKIQFQKLSEFKCFIKTGGKPCKVDKKFPNIAFLKKHLKEVHKRSFCDVCLEKKTCVLEQQQLYTQAQLTRHLERGDLDECGNIVFMHPYCGFCKEYFFDDEVFRLHLNFNHETCNVCGSQHKYRYYKNYEGLETHYKMSHYICTDKICLDKKFIAFKTAEELKVHKYQYHDIYGSKRIDGRQLCGFQYEGHENEEDIIQIKDNEGIYMENQFLSLKKAKNRALGQADQQEDTIIDVRNFYPSGLDEDQHFKNSFVLKHRNKDEDNEEEVKIKKKHGKKKYVEKNEFEKEKPQIAKENEEFYIEDLSLIHSYHLKRLHYDDFEDKLSGLLGSEDLKKIQGWKNKLQKKHLSIHEFITNFLEVMWKVSLRLGYEILPHFMRVLQNENLKRQFDQEYVIFLKKIPSHSKSILSTSHKYSDLFMQLISQLHKNIQARIVQGQLSIKKPIKRQKQRLYQIIGVLRRLKTEEMVKFKFANNFGVEGDTIKLVHDKILKLSLDNVQKRLRKIPNEQLLDLYVFSRYCLQAIQHSKNMHLAKNKIQENILEDFLFDRPHLEQKYGTKKSELKTLEEQVEYEKNEEEKNHKKKLKQIDEKNKNMGYHAKTNFNFEDKGDFPDLMPSSNKEQKSSEKQDFKEVISSVKQKPATYQKKINQLFPTLGGASEDNAPIAQKKPEVVEKVVAQKKQKAWWEKVNEKKIQIQEEDEGKVRKGKKKKQKWIPVKGLFN